MVGYLTIIRFGRGIFSIGMLRKNSCRFKPRNRKGATADKTTISVNYA